MSVKNTKHQVLGESAMKVPGSIASVSQKRGTKAPGTRIGTLDDWREGSRKGSGESSERGKRLRDGR